MKLTKEQVVELNGIQVKWRLSSSILAHYVRETYGVKISRQAIWKRLNNYSLELALAKEAAS
jgi:hypothetical protein